MPYGPFVVRATLKTLPAHLRYQLTRRQRLIPHLGLWGPLGPAFVVCFAVSLFATFAESRWFLVAVLIWAWCGYGYVAGLVGILRYRVCDVDLIIEPLGIGYLAAGQRWYVHMDGVLSIRQLLDGVWTIAHFNGTVFNVPADSMPDECVSHIRSAIERKWDYLQPFADEHKRKLVGGQRE